MSGKDVTDILKVNGINAKGFGVIAKLVMLDRRLTRSAKSIYSYFRSFAGNGTTAFPSIEKICYDLNFNTEDTLRKHRDLLVICGYMDIKRERTGKGKFKRNVYSFIENPEPLIDTKGMVNGKINGKFVKQKDIENRKKATPEKTGDGEISTTEKNGSGKKTVTENIGDGKNPPPSNSVHNINKSFNINSSFNKINLSKEQRTDGQIDEINIQVTKFNRILEQCELEYLDQSKKLAIENALEQLYFSANSYLLVDNNKIPMQFVKKKLERLNFGVIEHAFNNYVKATREKNIKNPLSYLKICIYNAISNMDLEIESELRRQGVI